MKKKSPSAQIFEIKITLKGIKPPIWRRVRVPSDMALAQLHDVIQAAMGWDNSHLHEFEIDGERFTGPQMMDEAFDMGDRQADETKVKLNKVVQPKSKFIYVYDFGDNWEHEILVEKTISVDEILAPLPYCVTGKRACPPEDCGGIWGYTDMLEKLAGPNNAERKELVEWLGSEFDPQYIDLDEINERLHNVST